MTQPAAGLGPGRPSRTSIMVAAGRAFGAREPDPSVRNPDHLAERLLGPAERELIREHPIAAALEGDYQQGRQDMQVASTANLMLVRTRFIDEHLLRALEQGATQVVILGAGFDTRGYRFQDQLRGKRLDETGMKSPMRIYQPSAQSMIHKPDSDKTVLAAYLQRHKFVRARSINSSPRPLITALIM